MLFLFSPGISSAVARPSIRSGAQSTGKVERERETEGGGGRGNKKVSVEKRLVTVAREVGVGMSQPR